MDKSLARGYARSFHKRAHEWSAIADGFNKGGVGSRLLGAIRDAALKKNPERALRRIRAILPKGCEVPNLIVKGHGNVALTSAIIGRAQRNAMFAPGGDECAFYEPSIEMARVIMIGSGRKSDVRIDATASISAHAIQRLLQRGATAPDRLEADVRKILYLADHVLWRMDDAGMERKVRDHTFLLPFRDGALVMTYTARDPTGEMQDKPLWSMSIRTFLSSKMLGDDDRARMELLAKELTDLRISQLTGMYYAEEGRTEEDLNGAWKAAIIANAQRRLYVAGFTPKAERSREQGATALVVATV